MCGIAGFFKKNDSYNPSSTDLAAMFKALQIRGTDATGWAWAYKDKVAVCKAAGSASDVLLMPRASTFLTAASKAKWALFHCRAGTHGTALDNRNNHPIFTDTCILIHNGVVNYADKKELPLIGDCDSELIARLIDKFGFQEAVIRINGSIAIAFHLFEDPDAIYLYREDNPIEFVEDDDKFVFASGVLALKEFTKETGKALPTYAVHRISNQGSEKVFQVKPPTYATTYSRSISTPTGHFITLSLNKGTDCDVLLIEDPKTKEATPINGYYTAFDKIFAGDDGKEYYLDFLTKTYTLESTRYWNRNEDAVAHFRTYGAM